MVQEFSNCGNWKVYGNPNPKIMVAGHSHTYAMFTAIQNNPELSENFGIVAQADFSSDRAPDDDYWNFVVELAKKSRTAISWNGNQHNLHFLIDTKLKFNTVGYFSDKRSPVVPINRIRNTFNPTFYELGSYLSRFSDPSNILLLGTPSPMAKTFLDKRIADDYYFGELAVSMGIPRDKISASSDELRVFMWKITQELTEEVSLEFGCKYIPVPKSAYDANSILNPEFYAGDLTHANESFGTLMLNEISRFGGF
jgi:hypothetical protein